VINEQGEPWWNNIDRRKILKHPPELSGKPKSSHIVAKQEEIEKEIMNFALRNISFILARVNTP
jgi:hypothetical protein